jgi:hypothetical protein
MKNKAKIFIYKRLPYITDSLLLKLMSGENEIEGKLFYELMTKDFAELVEFVDNPEKSDVVMIPHSYFHVNKKGDYINEAVTFSERYGKKLLLFTNSDFTTPINITNSIVLRTSSYKSDLLTNEIVIPAWVEDLGTQEGISFRKKTSKPTVGFAGMVHLGNLKEELSFQVRALLCRLKSYFDKKCAPRCQGLFYRRRAIKVLEDCSTCHTNFIIRNFFSANKKTIKGKTDEVRREFIDAIDKSDLPLVVRGNGNFSLRFFEVLSLGRVPLFIDTDVGLPLEKEIDYDSFMLRVNHSDIDKLPKIIDNFWSKLSDEEYLTMQKKAREVFETKLKPAVFYSILFKKLAEGRV